MTIAQATTATSQTAEGVKSAGVLLALAHRHGVEMPITEVVVDIVEGRYTARDAADLLMSRSPKPERYRN